MAAAGEFATVFLETSLGTRLVVSFPASATTVADLKQQVTAEHAACFPQSGPIVVKSVQVKHDGSLFHLTNSMVVERAFHWVQGPWHLLVEACELRSHPLCREDANCGTEQNSGDPVTSNSAQNMSTPAVTHRGDNLGIGDGVRDTPMLNQLDKPHQDLERVSDHLEDEDVVLRETSELYLAADGSDTPSMDQQDRWHEDVEQNASGQPEDRNVKTMLQESSNIDLATGGRVPRAKNQLDKSNEVVERVLSQCRDGNVKNMLQESSSLAAATGEGETQSMNQQDKCYQGVKHTSGQLRNGTANAMFQENSDLNLAACGRDTPSIEHQDQWHEGVEEHASGQHEDGNAKTMLQETSNIDLATGGNVPCAKSKLDKSHEDVVHALSQCKDDNVKNMIQESLSLDAAAGEGEASSMNHQDICYQGVEHASEQPRNGTIKAPFQENSDLIERIKHALEQCEDGSLKIMPEESSNFDVAASESEIPQMNQLDESHKDIRYASRQLEDGIVNIMLLKISDFDQSVAAKDNCPMRGQQKDVIAEPRGTELFRKENTNNKNIIGNCDDNIFSLSSSRIMAEEKSSGTEQENLNRNPLAYNQGNCSYVMGKKPSRHRKEPWTSKVCNGESSNNVSGTQPCVQSMNKDSSFNRQVNAHRNDEEETWVAGLCSGESSFKETDVPHCIKSMEKRNRRPASNDQFLKKRKYEGATTSISTEDKSCFKTRQQRIISVRKVPMSKAPKIFNIRCLTMSLRKQQK